MSAAIEISALTVELGGARVLGALDLALETGTYVLVVGPSGSGKTTLLRTIAGLTRPKRGRIALGGALASDGARIHLRPEQRGIGFLFQGGGLWPHMSVARTLEFVLACRGVERSARSQRVADLLAWVELNGFEKRLPGSLSGGEAQRLALARALAVEPKILLLDEPLGPLDAELRGALIAKLSALRERRELSVLHVTHDPREVAHLATRTVRLAHGRLADAPVTSAAASLAREADGT